MKQKYTDNIAYLWKRDTTNAGIEYSEESIPFQCNVEDVKKRSLNAMTGVYMSSSITVIKTTTQIEFTEHDRISFMPVPPDDDAFSMIIDINPIPMNTRGNKHRTVLYNEYWITIS